ncbi:tetratricopeptide repeat protein [Brucella gallinifaecis]|uniref:tetratricopeptide repeat protein n=1 Tax=Brucella gallinifaecis TaxID=215590 RepID=UPI00236248F5|nr:tetratricopeptide repeat protein [Brucella gallinifaecis]
MSDGNWFAGGYLAGFQETIEQAINWSVTNCPSLVELHQQTLKRLYPHIELLQFTVPKDLTNTSSKEERTRFYHHEYQNKLLVGLSEFLIQVHKAQNVRTILIVDRANGLSPTAQNLLKTIQRLDGGSEVFKFVLLDYDRSLFITSAVEVPLGRYPEQELMSALGLDDTYSLEKKHRIYTASRGNLMWAKAIVECDKAGIPVVGYIDPAALVDLHLSTRTLNERQSMLVDFIDQGCKSDNYIAVRNYDTFDSDMVDLEHLRLHAICMERYLSGVAPLVTLHAQRIRDKRKRLEALAEPSEILKSIGLYDTWFSYFAEIMADADLRRHGTGNDPANAAFINAAFVLYSLGCGSVSVPYLEEFYQTFPKSRYTPTVLYAQSMTYGRYQQPVNLPLAERYALRNLQIIESDFREYDKYHYIKVFAENAYAYIKARQGKYDEALKLCTNGNRKMLEIYGDNRFKLHQSILIYNTIQVYEIVKDYDLAEKQLRLAISYDPYYGEYHNDLGNLLCKIEGREREALQAYARAIELCPPYYEAHLNRGVLLVRLGESDAALLDFKRALEIKRQEPRALFEIGNVLLMQSNYPGALNAYRAAAEIEPNNPDLQSNIGLAYSEIGNPCDSISHYRQAIALQPNHALSHNNLAIELYNTEQYDAALQHANLAVSLDGDPDYEVTRDFILKRTVA